MKPEVFQNPEHSISSMQSTSTPFPVAEKANVKKNRYPQFRANNRVLSQQSESESHEQHDLNNTRRSASAGAVLCKNSQRGSPRAKPTGAPIRSRKLEFFDSDDKSVHPPNENFSEVPYNVCKKPSNYSSAPMTSPHSNYAKTCTYFNPQGDYPFWLGPSLHETSMGLKVTAHGFISIQLQNDVRVDITLDQAIRCITNSKGMIVSLSSDGTRSSLLHPSGSVYQYGSRVEMSATHSHGNTKYAKMWGKGISFTSEQSALVYLVDSAGPRTVTDCFSDLHSDYTLPIFLEESMHGPYYVQDCIRQVQNTEFWVSSEGTLNWALNGIRISQGLDGLVRVARNAGKYVLRISAPGQSATLTTPNVHATVAMNHNHGHGCHIFIKRGEKRMHYDGSSFIVRNGTHAAGFDEKGQFKVY